MDKPGRWERIDTAWGNVYTQCCWGWKDPPQSDPEEEAVRAALNAVVDLIAASIWNGDSDPYSNFEEIRRHIAGLPSEYVNYRPVPRGEEVKP